MKKIQINFISVAVFIFFSVFSIFFLLQESKRIFNHIRHNKETLSQTTEFIDTRLNWSTIEKDSLSKLAIKLNFFLTGTYSSTQVAQGKENWLFYVNKIDGNPLGIYEGKNIYSNEEIGEALISVKNVNEKLHEKGINFCVLFAPNKENIYYKYMPLKYKFYEPNCADKLLDKIENEGISVIKAKKLLQENSEKEFLYYPHDTHWTTSGSFFAAKAFFDFYNLPFKNFEEINLIQNDSSKQQADLENLIGLKGLVKNDFLVKTPDYFLIPLFDEHQLSNYQNESSKTDKTLLIIGDSFRCALPLHFTDYFKNVYIVHRDSYEKDIIEKIKPDYVIAEYAERYAIQIRKLENLMFKN